MAGKLSGQPGPDSVAAMLPSWSVSRRVVFAVWTSNADICVLDDATPLDEPHSLSMYNRESDDEDSSVQGSNHTNSNGSNGHVPGMSAHDSGELQDGMLPRDLPKRTTHYDPIAERQMTQTDAKLFYQRSKIDGKTGSGIWTQSTPHGSPVIVSGSRPPTDYGGDSLVLDQDSGKLKFSCFCFY